MIIPLLLTWIYLSWIVVLFGAEIAFALQHVGRTGTRSNSRRSVRRLRAAGLLLSVEAVKAHDSGGRRPRRNAGAR